MAEDRERETVAPGESRSARALRVVGRFIGLSLDRIQRNPLRDLSVFVAVATAIAGIAIGARYLTVLSPRSGPPEIRLEEALEKLDTGYLELAREMAVALRRQGNLDEEELGAPAYVLGVAMMKEAERRTHTGERRSLNLLAARYLEEALELGLPANRLAHGQFMLGKAQFESGRFSASLAPLLAALNLRPEDPAIHQLLAEAYLRDSTPQLSKAVDHIQRYLALPAIEDDERSRAIITAAEIQLQLNELDACRELLAQLPAGSSQRAQALLMEGKILLRDGDQIKRSVDRAEATEAPPSAMAVYQAAKNKFLDARTAAPTNGKVIRKAQFLLGRAHQALGELEAAEEYFSRTRRSSYDTDEGRAAGFEDSEVKRLLRKDDEAIEGYGRAIRQAADLPVYSNAWISLQDMRKRCEVAYQDYFDRGDFDRAIRMANALTPLFSAERSLEFQAIAHRAEADRLWNLATETPEQEDELFARSQKSWRQAGALYERLAQERFATRQYPEMLWHAAESYLKGQDYRRSSRLLNAYIRSEIRRKHPPALTLLGEAHLALGEPETALESLHECIELFPRDPHSYQARLLAAEALVEIGKLDSAKELLVDNLENGDLTPRSPEWRGSLYALGKIYYREGLQFETASRQSGVNTTEVGDGANPTSSAVKLRNEGLKQLEIAHDFFQKAILRLSEAVQRDELRNRDPYASETIEARYLIAEAYRQSAKSPLRKSATVQIETVRNQLNAQIQRELTAAADHYESLQRLLNLKQEEVPLKLVEQKLLRNSYFARGDVLYDLGRFEDSIRAYATATNRYHHEPEALEAYIQIANCHRLLNRPAEAKGTLEQAKVVLNQIRPDADFNTTTRYSREEWGRLLDWLTTS